MLFPPSAASSPSTVPPPMQKLGALTWPSMDVATVKMLSKQSGWRMVIMIFLFNGMDRLINGIY